MMEEMKIFAVTHRREKFGTKTLIASSIPHGSTQEDKAMLKSFSAAVSGIEIDPQQGGMSLTDFEWRYRVVIIFPDDTHIEAARQANLLLAAVEGLRARDMIVLEVGHNDVKALFGPEHDLNCYAIRSDLDVTDGFFAMMLVGKDGAVKFRTDDVVPASVLFDLIDQMPVSQKKQSN